MNSEQLIRWTCFLFPYHTKMNSEQFIRWTCFVFSIAHQNKQRTAYSSDMCCIFHTTPIFTCWPTVFDVGQTENQCWAKVSWLLGWAFNACDLFSCVKSIIDGAMSEEDLLRFMYLYMM